MRLTSEVQVVSRLCPTLNIKTSAKAVRCQLAIGKKPASADKTIFIMISTTQNLSGHFYKIHENIEAIHCKFINEGKASIRVKQPAMDIMISKAESSQLKKFVQLIKIVVMKGSLSDGEAPSQLSTLTPVTGKTLNNVKVKKIFGRENYPITEGFPSGLTHLQISYCRLGKLDSRILGLRGLTQLDLSNNKLTFVPHELKELPLTLLNFSKNNICNLSEDFCKESTLSSSLQTLNLEDNPKLSRLPVTLHNLSKLHTLNVSRCSLTRLPSMIGFIRSLCFLYIADNKIRTLPHSFLRLRLDQLQASGNEFIAPTDVVESRFQSPVPTMEELAARALRLHNVAVTKAQVFPDMWQYLNSAKRCFCGSYCFESFACFLNFVPLIRLCRVFSTTAGNNSMEGPVECFLCSPKCLRTFYSSRQAVHRFYAPSNS